MKILFAASEARPFIATGGLADVANALPKSLCESGEDCRVILPLYADIAPELRELLTFQTDFKVRLGWRNQYCGLFSAKYDGVVFYFLDNEYYFGRPGIYGHADDAERFAFFSMAVLEAAAHMDFTPEILHCNDWQTGLVPVFYDAFYRRKEGYRGIRTLFAIHNIQYQGRFGLALADDLLGLPRERRGVVEWNGDCNFMKGGIDRCDAVCTVSPTYAEEILDPWFACGLDGLLRERRYKLAGILNGIDYDAYDPQYDPVIKYTYTAEDLSGKAKDKAALQTELGLEPEPETMLVGIVSRLAAHKGFDLVRCVGDELMALPIELAVLGSGEAACEAFFRGLQDRFPGRVRMVTGFDPRLAKLIYAGSDAFLMPSRSEPCGLSQMVALRYGSIPIVRETGGLKDSVRDLGGEGGNGFTFKTYNAHDMLDAVRRCAALYEDKEKWRVAVAGAMRCDNSWRRSAKVYRLLYEKLRG